MGYPVEPEPELHHSTPRTVEESQQPTHGDVRGDKMYIQGWGWEKIQVWTPAPEDVVASRGAPSDVVPNRSRRPSPMSPPGTGITDSAELHPPPRYRDGETQNDKMYIAGWGWEKIRIWASPGDVRTDESNQEAQESEAQEVPPASPSPSAWR